MSNNFDFFSLSKIMKRKLYNLMGEEQSDKILRIDDIFILKLSIIKNLILTIYGNRSNEKVQ